MSNVNKDEEDFAKRSLKCQSSRALSRSGLSAEMTNVLDYR